MRWESATEHTIEASSVVQGSAIRRQQDNDWFLFHMTVANLRSLTLHLRHIWWRHQAATSNSYHNGNEMIASDSINAWCSCIYCYTCVSARVHASLTPLCRSVSVGNGFTFLALTGQFCTTAPAPQDATTLCFISNPFFWTQPRRA